MVQNVTFHHFLTLFRTRQNRKTRQKCLICIPAKRLAASRGVKKHRFTPVFDAFLMLFDAFPDPKKVAFLFSGQNRTYVLRRFALPGNRALFRTPHRKAPFSGLQPRKPHFVVLEGPACPVPRP